MHRTKIFLTLLACLFVSSCVTAQSDVDTLRHQVRALERQQQRDQQEMNQLLESTQEKITQIELSLDQAGGSVQATQANLWAEVESMRVQVATLTGRLDALERQFSETREISRESEQSLSQIRSRVREIDRSVQMISSQLGVEIAEREETPEPVQAPEPERTPVSVDSDSARVLYQRALDSFYDRNYDQAQSLWQEFSENFPDHALTSNAYFWQGESFYQMQQYAQAVLAYQEVITNFPDSNKMSASMLKQGMSFFNLGREEAGKLVLEELLRKFPETAEARRARAFISDQP